MTTDIQLFTDGRCNVCGHLEGDHERFPDTDVWTCDDDCDEDLNGHCHVGRFRYVQPPDSQV